eukprot:COSAG01_NODE_23092_length_828_cov_3.491084_1_plen_239_part_00
MTTENTIGGRRLRWGLWGVSGLRGSGTPAHGWFCHQSQLQATLLGIPAHAPNGQWVGDLITYSTHLLQPDGQGPLVPLLFSPAQINCTLNLGLLRSDILFLATNNLRFPDLEFLDESTIDGTRSRSRWGGHTRLAVNHNSFLDHSSGAFEFCQRKTADKQNFFAVNRLSPPGQFLPLVPGCLIPAGHVQKEVLSLTKSNFENVVVQAQSALQQHAAGNYHVPEYSGVITKTKHRMPPA